MTNTTTEKQRGPHGRLFDAVDNGLCTLPAEIADARAAADHLAGAVVGMVPPAAADEGSLIDAVARTGDAAAVDAAVATITRSTADAETFALRRRLVVKAADVARRRLVFLVGKGADEIVADHIAPAMAAVVDRGRDQVGVFGRYGTADGAFLSAPKSVRDAWVAFRGTVHEYSLLRSARTELYMRQEDDGWDRLNWFSEVKNLETAWPMFLVGNVRNIAAPPWEDEDFTVRMAKLLSTPRAELWCPTLEQQEARWWSVFGEQVEAQRQSTTALAATRARFEHVGVRREKAARAKAAAGT